MASVDLLTQDWLTASQNINIDATSSSINWSTTANEVVGYAKAWIEIDASEYKSVKLKYGTGNHTGNTSITFGVFNNTIPDDNSGKKKTLNATSSGSATINFFDSNGERTVSGIKYVGFYIWGNSWIENGWGYYAAEGDREIISITAELAVYTLTYDANGGSGAPSAVSDITSTTISNIVPTRSGYKFLGWSTSSSATYASYFSGNSISLTSDITLYAVWQKFYTITYNANGGSNAPVSDEKIDGQTIVLSGISPTPPTNTSVIYTVTLNANGGTCNPDTVTVTNITTYEFINWNTKSDGSGVTYQVYDLYAENSDITLYAQYEPITFNNSVFLPTPTRSGYKFLGWAENEYDLSGTVGEYTPTGDIILYATWERMGNVYIYDSTGGFNQYQVLIYDGSGWNQYIPYIYTESGWTIYSG